VVDGIADLNDSALDAVKQWVYKPMAKNLPVELLVKFRLTDPGCQGEKPARDQE
jgi:hypothetical protein